MNAPASNFSGFAECSSSLGEVLHALGPVAARPLVLEYGGRVVGAGYHVTEVKAGSFTTLDCGGNPDTWQETILQVEDLPGEAGQRPMTAGKFGTILAKVAEKVALNDGARLTFEVSRPGEAMQVFDVAGLAETKDAVTLTLQPRPAICKPRHRTTAKPDCCAA